MADSSKHSEGVQPSHNHVDNLLVVEADIRPTGKGSGVCLYCKEKIGQPHTWECVIPQKWVLVRMTADIPLQMPRSWDKDDIEFKLNESSWCSNNIIDELNTLEESGFDLCDTAEFEFLADGAVIDMASNDSDATTSPSNPLKEPKKETT